MKISSEWAKQLAFDAIDAKLDFGNMRIVYTRIGTKEFVIPIMDHLGMARVMKGRLPPEDYYPLCEHVKLSMIYDPLNAEITNLGYSRLTNTLVIGETIGDISPEKVKNE